MRQVVERITCDIGGETSYSDSTTLVLRTEQFSWQGKTYEFDTCGRCFGKVGTWSIHALIEKSREVGKSGKSGKSGTKPVRKRNRTPKLKGGASHEGEAPELSDDYLGSDGSTVCPSCGHGSPSMRGFKMHWSRSQKDEHRLRAVS